jgi:hypothetical protein
VALRNPDATSGLYVINGERQIVYAKKELSILEQHRARQKRWPKPK